VIVGVVLPLVGLVVLLMYRQLIDKAIENKASLTLRFGLISVKVGSARSAGTLEDDGKDSSSGS